MKQGKSSTTVTWGWLTLSLFLLATAGQSQSPLPAMGNREASRVAATAGYTFYSDLWLNLHQYLYGITGGGPERGTGMAQEATECFAGLDAARLTPWNAATVYYRQHMAARKNRQDPLMVDVRYRLNHLETEHSTDPQLAEVLLVLEKAAPAYVECLWPTHDRRNRELIGEQVSHLALYGPSLQRRLVDLYHAAAWPRDLAVDVVTYVSFAPANTAGGEGRLPTHALMATGEDDTAGFGGLEVLLHEASHLLFGAETGTITHSLNEAAEELGVATPYNLWHAVSFHTSGTAVQEIAAAEGVTYVPYWLRIGLFRLYQEPIQEHWQPYLQGEKDLKTAALDLVRATAQE